MRYCRIAAAALLIVGCGAGRDLTPIRLDSVAVIGADTGEGMITTSPRVSPRHPLGFRVLIPAASGVAALPNVYDDTGRFLGSLRGGADTGQRFVSPLFTRFGPGDSLWVFDGSGRVLVFDARRTFVRVAALPVSPWDAIVLADSRMVVAPANADRPLPLLLLDTDGRTIREIGHGDSAGAELHAPRWIVPGSGGRFWSMPTQFRWRLEAWDTTGAALGVSERSPAWFTQYSSLKPPDHEHAPQAALQGAWLDSTGRFWVLGVVADANWSAGISAGPPNQSAGVILDPDKAFDSVLEAYDLRSGEVVATVRVDPYYSTEVEPGVIMRVDERSPGSKRVHLMKVVLDATRASAKRTSP
jgi:hypothetical protein